MRGILILLTALFVFTGCGEVATEEIKNNGVDVSITGFVQSGRDFNFTYTGTPKAEYKIVRININQDQSVFSSVTGSDYTMNDAIAPIDSTSGVVTLNFQCKQVMWNTNGAEVECKNQFYTSGADNRFYVSIKEGNHSIYMVTGYYKTSVSDLAWNDSYPLIGTVSY